MVSKAAASALFVTSFWAQERPEHALVTGLHEPFPPSRTFLDQGGRPLLLLGQARRRALEVDFYDVALYVDLEALRARAKQKDPVAVAAALASGTVPHAYVTRFLREVGGNARLRFVQESLKRNWPGGHFEPNLSTPDPFKEFFSRRLTKGEISEVWLDGKGALFLRDLGTPVVALHSPVIARAFAASYFADPPQNPELRQELLKDSERSLAQAPPRRNP